MEQFGAFLVNFFDDFEIVFRYPDRLWYAILPILLFAFVITVKYVARTRVLKDEWVSHHIPSAHIAPLRAHISFFMWCVVAVLLLMSAWAEPERKITTTVPLYGQVRITFILDVSRSMVYADDIVPTRLAYAKKIIREFVKKLNTDIELKGKYSLALIPFAGGSIPLYSSFSTNTTEFFWFLNEMNENTVTTAGTNLEYALRGYEKLLFWNNTGDDTAVDIGVLISDGGKEEGVVGELKEIERTINNFPKNVKLITVGIGLKEVDKDCVRGRGVALSSDTSASIRTECLRTRPVALVLKNDDGSFLSYLREDPTNPQSKVLTSELDEETLMSISGRENYYFLEDEDKFFHDLKETILAHRIHVTDLKKYSYEPAAAVFLIPASIILFYLYGYIGWIFRLFSFVYNRSS